MSDKMKKLNPQIKVERSVKKASVMFKVSEVFGLLSVYKKKKPISVVQMDEGIKRAIRESNKVAQ